MSRSVRWALVGIVLFVAVVSSSFIALGSGVTEARMGRGHMCAIEDDAFVTADGGCKDLITGLVWGTKNMGHSGGGWGWRSARRMTVDSSEGAAEDWRMPTVDELREVLANGAATHFGPDHVFGDAYVYWSGEPAGSRRLAVNTNSHSAAEYLEETALYFVGVRAVPEPEPDPGE